MCDMLCTSPFEAWGEQCLVMLHASLFPYLLSDISQPEELHSFCAPELNVVEMHYD